MKELMMNIDENKLWEYCFPYAYKQSCSQGVYVVSNTENLLEQVVHAEDNDEEQAVLRLDMAIACIWPHVEELFCVDFFPHRLAAATDLLRAVDFGEGKDKQLNALGEELASALDNLEVVLAKDESESYLKAAEEADHAAD